MDIREEQKRMWGNYTHALGQTFEPFEGLELPYEFIENTKNVISYLYRTRHRACVMTSIAKVSICGALQYVCYDKPLTVRNDTTRIYCMYYAKYFTMSIHETVEEGLAEVRAIMDLDEYWFFRCPRHIPNRVWYGTLPNEMWYDVRVEFLRKILEAYGEAIKHSTNDEPRF